jgi:hypothetical protein
MSIVRIPTKHFVTSAKRQYADIDTAIIREAVQNSIDAGATKIEIETGPTWCKVTDNGCGMTEEVLVDAMLTMSGSHKSNSGAIGGFGAAKEILLFQHEKYEMHTLDNRVNGSVLEYDLTKTDFFQGTAITMHFHESYEFKEHVFLIKAKAWLKKCDMSATVTINGEDIEKLVVRTEVKDLGWGKIYCEDCKETNTYMTIRIKGVCMFQSYVGDIQKNIVLEITQPSTEILTSNRDGFQYTQAEIVQRLVEEITIDKKSFGRLHNTITRISGTSRAFAARIIRRLIEAQTKSVTLEQSVFGNAPSPARMKLLETLESIEKAVDAGEVAPAVAITTVREAAKELESEGITVIDKKMNDYINHVDFYIQINDKGYEKIPAEISPSLKMKMKYRKLACLWKASLKHVFQSNSMDADFCVGWIVDSNTVAKYVRRDGIETFLLNPYLVLSEVYKTNKKEVVSHILMSAVHEVAHRFQTYHDESFMGVYEKLLLKSISSLSSYRTLLIAAETETL